MEIRMPVALVLLLLILVGCGGGSNSESEPLTPVSPASMFMERNYHFCSDKQTDRFLLGHYGTEGMDNEIHFFIVAGESDTIFRDQWPAKTLLLPANGDGNKDLHEAMESFIDQAPVPELAGPTTGPAFTYQIGEQTHKIGFCKKSKTVIQL